MDNIDSLLDEIKTQNLDALAEDEEKTGELYEILLNTREQCEMVDQLIKNQIEVKDKLIDKLYVELDFYKKDSENRFVNQLMKAVIKIRKDMNKQILSDSWQEMSAEDLRREYQYCLEDITDLLEQQNVDPYQSEPGDTFDPAIHQAKIETTDNIELDKKIKKSISEGYMKDGKVLMAERVVVYQYKA